MRGTRDQLAHGPGVDDLFFEQQVAQRQQLGPVLVQDRAGPGSLALEQLANVGVEALAGPLGFMPKRSTKLRAIAVARSTSWAEPMVKRPSNSSSASRPPNKVAIASTNWACVTTYLWAASA